MDIVLKPLRLLGVWFMALGLGGLYLHHVLSAGTAYTPLFEWILLGATLMNVSLALFFLFLRRIVSFVFRIFMQMLSKRMGAGNAVAARRFYERMNLSSN